MKIREILEDYETRGFLFSAFSLFTTAFFFAYNLWMGMYYRIIWNFSISFYYLVLFALRTNIILHEKVWMKDTPNAKKKKRTSLFKFTAHVLLGIDLSLIIPISLMVLLQRKVSIGMIPAITIASYTFFKLFSSIRNYYQSKKVGNLSLLGLRIIHLKDAVVSVLTLQNTMVMVFDHGNGILKLTAYTSAAILLGMFVMTIFFMRKEV